MLDELKLRDFRNLGELEWRPGGGGHLLLGDNGAGKTSILEAIYVLATTKSFRTSRLAECRRHEASGFFVAGEVERGARWHLEIGDSEKGRHRTRNGDSTSLSEHLEVLPVLSWSEADQGLLTGGPEGRRRFIDRGLLGERPARLSVLARYRRTLGQKRQLLAQGDAASLVAWNPMMARAGAELVSLRAEMVGRLAEAFAAPVLPLEESESAALGAALQAAWVVAGGERSALTGLVERVVRTGDPVEPTAAGAALHAELGARFDERVRSIYGPGYGPGSTS